MLRNMGVKSQILDCEHELMVFDNQIETIQLQMLPSFVSRSYAVIKLFIKLIEENREAHNLGAAFETFVKHIDLPIGVLGELRKSDYQTGGSVSDLFNWMKHLAQEPRTPNKLACNAIVSELPRINVRREN